MAFLTHIRRYALLGLLVLYPLQLQASDTLQLAEQEIKAGLLYNFLKYTEWPVNSLDSNTGMTVCIFGADPFGGALQPMAGRTVNQRHILIKDVNSIEAASNCHLLFVNAAERKRWPEIKEFLADKHILTVSDFKGFAMSGGMIEFGQKDKRVHVELNLQELTAAGLQVQERLLRLVTVVGPASAQRQ